MYVEGDNGGQQEATETALDRHVEENVIDDEFVAATARPSSALTRTLSANNSLASDSGIGPADSRRLKVTLVPDKGYFLVGKASPAAQTYILTITVSFARHLIRVGSVDCRRLVDHCLC